MDIVALLTPIVSALSNHPAFFYGQEEAKNFEADKFLSDNDFVMMDWPVRSKDTVTKANVVQENYYLGFLFCRQTKLENVPKDDQQTIAFQRGIKSEFQNRLFASGLFSAILNMQTVDFVGRYDNHSAGCYLTITLTPIDNASLCLPDPS